MVDLRGVTKPGDKVVISSGNTATVTRGGETVAVVSGGKSTRIVSDSGGTSGPGTEGDSPTAVARQEAHAQAVEAATSTTSGSAEVTTPVRSAAPTRVAVSPTEIIKVDPIESARSLFGGGKSAFQTQVEEIRQQSIPTEQIFRPGRIEAGGVRKQKEVAKPRKITEAEAQEGFTKQPTVSQLEIQQPSTGEMRPSTPAVKFAQSTTGRSLELFKSSLLLQPTDMEPQNPFEAAGQVAGAAGGLFLASEGGSRLLATKGASTVGKFVVKGLDPKFLGKIAIGQAGIVTGFEAAKATIKAQAPEEVLQFTTQEDITKGIQAGQTTRTRELVGVEVAPGATGVQKTVAKGKSIFKGFKDLPIIRQTQKGQKAFIIGATEEFKAQGLEGEQLTLAIQEARRQDILTGRAEATALIASEGISEVVVGANVLKRGIKTPVKKSTLAIAKAIAPKLAVGSAFEGLTQTAIERRARGVVPTPKELAIGAGVGAVTGTAIGLPTASFVLSKPLASKTFNLLGQTLDFPGEILGDIGGKVTAKIAGRKPPTIIVPAITVGQPVIIETTTEVPKPTKIEQPAPPKTITPSTITTTTVPTKPKVPTPPSVPTAPNVPTTPTVPTTTTTPAASSVPNIVDVPTTPVVPTPPVVPTKTDVPTTVTIPITTPTDFLFPPILPLGGGGGFSFSSKGMSIPRGFKFAPDLFSIGTGATQFKAPKPGKLFTPFEQRRVVVKRKPKTKKKKGRKKKK